MSRIFCEFEVGCGISCYSEFLATVFPDTAVNCSFTIGIPEELSNANNFFIYPNPVTNELIVRWDNKEINQIIIVDMLGEKIHNSEIKNKSELLINTNNFSKGIYLIQAKTAKGLITKKFVKQ